MFIIRYICNHRSSHWLFFHQLAKWALSLPWIPLEGPLRLVASFHGSPVKFITALLGLIAGIWFAHSIMKLLLTVHITDDSVELMKGKHVQTINSGDIALVFIDHKRLVLLGTDGYELAREEIDEKPKIIEQAFKKHHYVWSAEGDPFKDKFRRWVPESPDLSKRSCYIEGSSESTERRGNRRH